MKRLTCEMCDSNNFLKEDGFFVCQACGCKYTVEEAKKMMIEGTVDVKGTVKVDNTDKVANYYKMAKTACESNNKTETEFYCNKIIEIEPTNYKAWFLKGKAAGWQSKLGYPRIAETINAFTNAIKYAPENALESLKLECNASLFELHSSLLLMRMKFFKNNPCQQEYTDIIESITFVNTNTYTFLTKTGIYPKDFGFKLALILIPKIDEAWKIVLDKYSKDHDGYPDDRAFSNFIEEGDRIIYLYVYILSQLLNEKSVKLDDGAFAILSNSVFQKDKYEIVAVAKETIKIYEKLIDCQQKIRDACSYIVKLSGDFTYHGTSRKLTDSAKESRLSMIKTYKANIKFIQVAINDEDYLKGKEKVKNLKNAREKINELKQSNQFCITEDCLAIAKKGGKVFYTAPKWNGANPSNMVSKMEDATSVVTAQGVVFAVNPAVYAEGNIAFAVPHNGSRVIALNKDGTVSCWLLKYSKTSDDNNVSNWKDIVGIAAGEFHTVGLKKDGTVIATGSNYSNQCAVEYWDEIIDISAGKSHTVGLKKDGTVVATGSNSHGQCDVSTWKDIVYITTSTVATVGITIDGDILQTGIKAPFDKDKWNNLAYVSLGRHFDMGLTLDGRILIRDCSNTFEALKNDSVDAVNTKYSANFGLFHEYDSIDSVINSVRITGKASKAACYVATCVYGSYDCPEVWTLRRFRDNTLGSTWYGRAFIKLYYAISPTLVKWFGKTKWFKKMWKGTLDKMVKNLQDKGVENTPYADKDWRLK